MRQKKNSRATRDRLDENSGEARTKLDGLRCWQGELINSILDSKTCGKLEYAIFSNKIPKFNIFSILKFLLTRDVCKLLEIYLVKA